MKPVRVTAKQARAYLRSKRRVVERRVQWPAEELEEEESEDRIGVFAGLRIPGRATVPHAEETRAEPICCDGGCGCSVESFFVFMSSGGATGSRFCLDCAPAEFARRS